MIAHFFGFIGKTLMFRNTYLVWFFSILFEILEQSLKQFLPNFYECWWDSLLLDVFGCNLAGILIGSYIIKKFNIQPLHWFYSPLPSNNAQALTSENLGIQESTRRLKEYEKSGKWHVFKSPINFLLFIWFIILNSLADVSYFILKKALNLPASHIIIQTKLFVFGFFAIRTCQDFYNYLHQPNCQRVIPFSIYLLHYILMSDYILAIRHLPSILIS